VGRLLWEPRVHIDVFVEEPSSNFGRSQRRHVGERIGLVGDGDIID